MTSRADASGTSQAHASGPGLANARGTRPAYAWVLNLDAEHELESPGAYTAPQRLRAIVARERQRLIGTLVQPGDVLVTQETLDAARRAHKPLAAGMPGFAWSPTPNALALLHAAGAHAVHAPTATALARVNARPFASAVRAPFAVDSFEKHLATNVEEVLGQLSLPAPAGWLVRRSFGAAGRGRRRISPGRPSDTELQWIEASLQRGPLTLEPWVEITREYTRSGWIAPNGQVTISAPCFQATTREGAWTHTELARAADVVAGDDARLAAMTEAAGIALAQAGYFGPFGIDAFRHRAPGRRHDVLNPMSEINARFTMDWATAFPRSTGTPRP